MRRRSPINVAASVRARLLALSKERREDFTLTLVNYAVERFLYRLSRSPYRDRFVLKGAMLFAVRIGEQYRPTRDLDLLGLGEATEAAIDTAVRAITSTTVEDDGLVFDVDTLEVQPIREDNRYGGGGSDLSDTSCRHGGTERAGVPTETIVAEKAEAMVDLGISNSRMKDFTDIAMAARRVAFDGDALTAAMRATFRRRHTPLVAGEIVALSERFVQDASAQANWKAFATRNRPRDFESLAQVVSELRAFLREPLEHARTGEPFIARWEPGGPWT
jgi:hypothetical protein